MSRNLLQSHDKISRIPELCAGIAVSIALLALAGWLSGFRFLAGEWGIYIPMAPSTALMLLLLSSALFVFARLPALRLSRLIVLSAVSIVFLLGVSVLVQFIFGLDFSIEKLLFSTNHLLGSTSFGRMSPLTAISFLLEGAALLWLSAERQRNVSTAALFAFGATAINAVVLIGYAYGAPLLYGGTIIPVALPTASAFALVGLGLFYMTVPGVPWLRDWSGASMRGILLRAFLPVMLLFLLLDGWVDAQIVPRMIFNPALYLALKALTAGCLLVLIIGWIAQRIGSEIERVQAALAESETRFRSVFENSPLGKSMTTMDGTLKVNKAFCNIVGYSEDELKTKNWREITHPEDIQKSLDVVQSLVDGNVSSAHFEKRYIHKNGSLVWTEVTTALHKNESGKPLYFLTALSDITQRRQIEEALARQTVELRRSNDELQQFAYVASHDLQEPLRMVASYTKLLEKRYKGRLDEDADEFINYVVDGATRMQQLINSLLDYSRVGTHAKEFVSASCESALKEALANLAIAIEDSRAVVAYDPLPTLMADESQLIQLFQNLIGNAIRFQGEQPPVIHISAEKRQADWLFSVRDNGIGMESQYFERIFVIFQRLHARAEYPGTGIGLAICKKIVERLGGRIWVESEPGKGTTFRFTIPIEKA